MYNKMIRKIIYTTYCDCCYNSFFGVRKWYAHALNHVESSPETVLRDYQILPQRS